MPMERDRYPRQWRKIARAYKTLREWRCEDCGRECRCPTEDFSDFIERIRTARMSECPVVAEFFEAPTRFVLTVAHLNQDPGDNRMANLRALCSVCHLRYDAPFREANRMAKRERHGQLTLPLSENL